MIVAVHVHGNDTVIVIPAATNRTVHSNNGPDHAHVDDHGHVDGVASSSGLNLTANSYDLY